MARTASTREGAHSHTRFPNKKLLVIDDEQRLAQSLASLLRGVGYDVEAVFSGEAGLERMKAGHIDLVITDLRMEGVDGFDIMNHITQHCPNTALIVITGHASMHSAIEALHQRAADYITKPFDFQVLQSAIERVLVQQEADQLRRDMANMLTHDIKVPLTNILGFSQLVAAKVKQDPVAAEHHANVITMNCRKLLLMLDNYLTNTRLEEGRLETNITQVNIPSMIQECLEMVVYEFEKKSIDIDFDLDSAPEFFEADEALLCRAVSNLVTNAVKYTPMGERVKITAAMAEGELLIRVANTGCSLTAEESQELFNRYHRASSASGTDGVGLGLHVVRSVAEAHGGRAWCECHGEEICFCIAIPPAE